MLWVLVSIELAGGTSAAFDTPSLPPDGSRQQRVLLRVHSWNCTLAMLAEGFRSARLETRTKECNMRASWWVSNP